MKNILLLLLIIGIVPSIGAQIVFSKVYDLEQHMDRAANIFLFDSILISIGAADNLIMGPDGLGVLATDLSGNRIWDFTIDGFAGLRLNIATADENYLYAAINDLRGDTPEEKIIRITPDGSYDFFEPYQFYGIFLENPSIWQLYKTPTGFIAGIDERLEAPSRSRYSVIEYDENFVPQSLNVYKSISEVFLTRRLKYDPTGNYVGSGNTIVLGEFIQAVKKVDEGGNTQWIYELPNSNDFFLESPIAINEMGETIVAYIQEFYNPTIGSLERLTMLTKLSQDGTVLWETSFSEENIILTNNMFLTENNDIIMIGEVYHEPFGKFQGKVNRLDQNGNIIWEKIYSEDRYGGINSSRLYNGFEMENGDLVFAGSLVDTVNNIPLAHQDFWLLRVGPDGCYISNCDDHNLITSVEEPNLVIENQYFLTPTIANNTVKIQAKSTEWTPTSLSISVVNISGQRMVTKGQSVPPYELDIIDYPSGLYFVTISHKTGQTQTLKFVKP